MVVLWVGGKSIGTVSDADLLPRLLACKERVLLKSESGQPLGEYVPVTTPAEPLIPWEPGITQEEIDRRLAEPGYTLDELKRKLGWA